MYVYMYVYMYVGMYVCKYMQVSRKYFFSTLIHGVRPHFFLC